ncbi:Indolepyruvate oxidoreductase subunit IorA [Nymphon striatum]|nr:Indolepyruvate oxidoreductase subunit IorA [Nymphon striatum]
MWYGKGPGVDRSGDVMRHANMAGTSPHGGVLMAMGDDHTGESSTTLHQSDWAMVDAYMPVLSPAGVQEILDYGLYGWALSRFSGLWVGLKTMKDTIEVTSVVDGRPDRMSFVEPEFEMPEEGLNIQLIDTPQLQEARIGFVAAGKNYLDLVHAFSLLGIDAEEAERLGITMYKVGQVWPLDMDSFHDFADGLDLIVVVEEKRKLIEVQVKEAIFDDRKGRRVYGWHKGDTWENGRQKELFPTRSALDPIDIAEKLGEILIEEGRRTDRIDAGLAKLAEAKRSDNAQDIAVFLFWLSAQ